MRDYDLTAQVSARLTRYCKDIQDGAKKSADKRSDELRYRLKRDSPRRAKGSRKRRKKYTAGSYARSWTRSRTKNTFSEIEYTVFNRSHYQLTHLLEYGHLMKGGGFVDPIEHILPAGTTSQFDYLKDVRKIIQKANKE